MHWWIYGEAKPSKLIYNHPGSCSKPIQQQIVKIHFHVDDILVLCFTAARRHERAAQEELHSKSNWLNAVKPHKVGISILM